MIATLTKRKSIVKNLGLIAIFTTEKKNTNIMFACINSFVEWEGK